MSLDPHLHQRCRPHLEPGENPLWLGRPQLRRYFARPLLLSSAGIIVTMILAAFISDWLRLRLAPDEAGGVAPFGSDDLLAGLFFLPFLLLAAGALLTPVFALLRWRSTCYAITDRRVLALLTGRSPRVEAFPVAELRTTERVEHPDGSGDLIAIRNPRDAGGVTRSDRIEFQAIPEPRRVERLLRRAAERARG